MREYSAAKEGAPERTVSPMQIATRRRDKTISTDVAVNHAKLAGARRKSLPIGDKEGGREGERRKQMGGNARREQWIDGEGVNVGRCVVQGTRPAPHVRVLAKVLHRGSSTPARVYAGEEVARNEEGRVRGKEGQRERELCRRRRRRLLTSRGKMVAMTSRQRARRTPSARITWATNDTEVGEGEGGGWKIDEGDRVGNPTRIRAAESLSAMDFCF